MASPNPRKRRRLVVCASVAAAVLLLGLILLILGLTVFKRKSPSVTVNAVDLADLDFALDLPRLRVLFNVSLRADVTVHNPNRVGFRYSNGTAYLRYRGADVGEAPLPAGRVRPRGSTDMNVTLTLMADRLITDPNFLSDAVDGSLPFQTYIRLSGKVRILFTFHVVAYATCDLEIHPLERTVLNQTCHYRTKL